MKYPETRKEPSRFVDSRRQEGGLLKMQFTAPRVGEASFASFAT